MKRAHLTALGAVLLFAVTGFAGGLSKYKGWDKSPQGDLMTADERAQWRNVKTDDAAETFVKDFLARRGPTFVTDITRATAAADKYFSVGKLQGSLTERGRLVIILGPPGGLTMSDREIHGDMRATPDTSLHIGTGGQGASASEMADAANGAGTSSGVIHTFTFTYTADKLPAAYGKALKVNIEVDPSGKDYIADRDTRNELDKVYEMAAQAKLAASAPPAK